MFSKKDFAIVSNFRFISMTNFTLSWVEHEKSFITSGPDEDKLTVHWNYTYIYSNSWLSIFSTGSWERNRIGEREVSRKLPK